VASAGFGIARAGSAGLAAAAERLEVRTTAIIISAFAEALGIYGIVIAFFILAA
jgi:F0F1-type ATP synthase membrane subunit c/vacuolar-type H+-ATPase subunit K